MHRRAYRGGADEGRCAARLRRRPFDSDAALVALSRTGVQWIINVHLLALAVTFAVGGRLSDILGHGKMGAALLGLQQS